MSSTRARATRARSTGGRQAGAAPIAAGIGTAPGAAPGAGGPVFSRLNPAANPFVPVDGRTAFLARLHDGFVETERLAGERLDAALLAWEAALTPTLRARLEHPPDGSTTAEKRRFFRGQSLEGHDQGARRGAAHCRRDV